ncbi:Rieske (2Fe-2S) protein [Specibacter sp. RAF43]|uniref:Rieske (2Fe-2S) protein n=1 Tax=Specibacter sp. RAF43 TaxID=3233057 RepID=UPI003F9B4726
MHAPAGVVGVLSNECSHLSGPLDQGRVVGRGGESCVECPWHGSRFSLGTGEVVRGPATAPQARFTARVMNGGVEVCLPHAG